MKSNWITTPHGSQGPLIIIRKLVAAAQLTVLCLLSPLALASDGVVEINHICASQLGCFSGDTVGYPITIDGSAGSSYRLTSNLIVPDSDTDGIGIAFPGISIDLNGFEIVRLDCVGAVSDCTALGVGNGIGTLAGGLAGVSVKNGTITGMGNRGVNIGGVQSMVTGVRVRWSGSHGITVSGTGSIVSGNTVFQNGLHGISAGRGASITGNTAYLNVRDGISAAGSATISDNNAYQNGLAGIQAFSEATISGNIANENGTQGIRSVFGGSSIRGNTAIDNGDDGISSTFGGSLVQGNLLQNNTGFGLDLNSTDAYWGNSMTGNTAGAVDSGTNMGANFCDTAVCP